MILPLIKTPLILYKGPHNWRRMWLKDETKQITHAFKYRGVRHKFLTGYNDLKKGVVTASTGNHALAVSYCAKAMNIPATIFVPKSISRCKYEQIRALGATVISENITSYDDAVAYAIQEAKQGKIYIPSFTDPKIIQGHQSILEETQPFLSENSTIFCPIGGGGLLTAIINHRNEHSLTFDIRGVELKNFSAMAYSLAQKKNSELSQDTIKKYPPYCEGLLVSKVGDIGFRTALNNSIPIETVSVDEIDYAISQLYKYENLKAEGAGAASFAAAIKDGDKSKDCLCIISGGNIEEKFLRKITEE